MDIFKRKRDKQKLKGGDEVGPCGSCNEDKPLDTGRKWENIRSCLCTYVADEGIEASVVSKYDALILEPSAVSSKKIEEIKTENPNVYLIGYISIGETSTLLEDSSGKPLDIYFLDDSGNPLIDHNWGSYYVDPRKPIWRRMVIEQYLPEILDKGFDGLFLDTVDISAIDRFQASTPGMSDLVRKIKKAALGKRVVMNRGFHLLLGDSDDVSDSIDGVMFESYSSTWYPNYHTYPLGGDDYNWTEHIAKRLNSIRFKNGSDGTIKRDKDGFPVRSGIYFNVFALDYVTYSDIGTIQYCVNRAYSYAFVPSIGTKNLSEPPCDWKMLVAIPSEEFWGDGIK